ncbi:hypothetical protein RHRU231_210090 [Rhodococcus ruber]|uniref:Transposase n=1 Tax=Rhodococcus ruber TaxID=1830 RepID=A0A098BEK2_9NOCA|nr:hypothetical protein RHRU231_210090 [Rhodococcus ruber]
MSSVRRANHQSGDLGEHPRQRHAAIDGRRDPGRAVTPWSASPHAGRLRADNGYDSAVHRRWLRERSIVPRIPRGGIESSERLGRYRWKIERTLAWLTGYCRMTIRYERHGAHFAGFLQLAAAPPCWKKLAKRDIRLVLKQRSATTGVPRDT